MKAGSIKAGTFDALRLARDRGILTGSLDVEMSERLEDRTAPGPGTVAWRIEGTADELGRPAIAIDIEGAVPVTCQRCLCGRRSSGPTARAARAARSRDRRAC